MNRGRKLTPSLNFQRWNLLKNVLEQERRHQFIFQKQVVIGTCNKQIQIKLIKTVFIFWTHVCYLTLKKLIMKYTLG